MSTFTACALQRALVWHDPKANRHAFARQMDEAGPADLYVLPEMFATGFSMSGQSIAESEDGPTLQWMRDQAIRRDAAITGSVAVQHNGQCLNRMYWVQADGTTHHYDKRHLFRMAGEHERYAAGGPRKIVSWRGLRFLLQVCYDLRFPVFSRNFQTDPAGDYDVILYVACWPEPRRQPWSQLLPARAVENQAYVIGVNRIGEDAKGLSYSGDSAIYDFKGDTLASGAPGEELSLKANLDLDTLNSFREKFPVGLDADRFTLSD